MRGALAAAACLAAGLACAGEARLLPGSTETAKRLAVTGEGPALIYEWATLDAACRALPAPAFYAYERPTGGALSAQAGPVLLRTGDGAACPQPSAPGVRLFYTPDPGRRGADGFVLRVVEADGVARTFTVTLDVR